jgi:uncharacterized membrane protein YeiH
MSIALPKYASNSILAFLGFLALAHSVFRFGTGELPEAILAGLLFLNAFSSRRQPWIVIIVAVFAILVTWTVNWVEAPFPKHKWLPSWIGIALFTVLALSRYTERFPTRSG